MFSYLFPTWARNVWKEHKRWVSRSEQWLLEKSLENKDINNFEKTAPAMYEKNFGSKGIIAIKNLREKFYTSGFESSLVFYQWFKEG